MAVGGVDTNMKADLLGTQDSTTIHFIAGNPFVETFQGLLHLFQDDDQNDIEISGKRSQTVCILAVPATTTCTDLLSFLAPCQDDIKHVRIIRDGSPNQYMALVTFRSPKSVVEFYKSFNGIPFNTLEPDWRCHLVFVSRVEALDEESGHNLPPSSSELPTCPVCLERMDESVDGILTILCNHAFHASCLAKWGDTSCPVCRYIQTPEPSGENHCLECMAVESLWICLICGHVGCGRYLQGHAYQHYIDTHHCYSMQLGTNHVWDYVGDNFVHRILQNKGDGKLVEGPNPEKICEAREQIDSIQLEYTTLLASQLESQKAYYEDMLAVMEHTLEETIKENAELADCAKSLEKEKVAIEKKYQLLLPKYSSFQKELNEEQELHKAMVENQELWKQKFTRLESEFNKFTLEKTEELDRLNEQLRDLMIHLEVEQTISTSEERKEIMEGTIEIPEPPGEGTKKRRPRPRR